MKGNYDNQFLSNLAQNLIDYRNCLFPDYVDANMQVMTMEIKGLKQILNNIYNIYKGVKTKEHLNILDEYLAEHKSYLELINNYVDQIVDINSNLATVTDNDIEIERTLLWVISRLSNCLNQIVKLEQYTEAVKNNSKVDLVATKSVLGESILIAPDCIKNYNDLVASIKPLSIKLKDLYKWLRQMQGDIRNNELDNELTKNNNELNNLERYDANRKNMEKIEQAMGVKELIIVSGKEKWISRPYVSWYDALERENNKLQGKIYEQLKKERKKQHNTIGIISNEDVSIKHDNNIPPNNIPFIKLHASLEISNQLSELYPLLGSLLVVSAKPNSINSMNKGQTTNLNMPFNNNFIFEKDGDIVAVDKDNPDAKLKIEILLANGYTPANNSKLTDKDINQGGIRR